MAEGKKVESFGELNIYQKINKISQEIGHIEKTGRNAVQGYSFIEQAEIMARARTLFEKYGITIIPATTSRKVKRFEVVRGNGKQGVDTHVSVVSEFMVVNSDKPEENFTVVWDGGEAIDSGDKATNKAITASQKYFYIKLFNISEKDDPDQESPTIEKAVKPTAPSAPVKSPAQEDEEYAPATPHNQVKMASDKQKAWLIERGYDEEAVEKMTMGEASDAISAKIKESEAKKATEANENQE